MGFRLLSLVFCFGLCGTLLCQSIEIKIVDSETQEALVYANCSLVNNRQLGYSTDPQGVVSIAIENKKFIFPNDTIICTYLGYEDLMIPIDLTSAQKLTYEMHSSSVALAEIEVTAIAKNYTGLEIVKKAIKTIKANYNQKPVYLNAFYRELIYEDKTCIQLNEAFTQLHYTGYKPKGRFQKKPFRHYWKDVVYGATWEYGFGKYLFQQSQSFYYFNTKSDQAKIVDSRASQNWSAIGMEPAPHGGPLSLMAADKVKFKYDFLDKKNFDKYYYNYDKAVYHKGNLCYLIKFHPRATDKRVSQNISKKMDFAIYAGQLYVDINSFAIIGFECQTSELADISIYKGRPYRTEVKVDYQELDGKWCIGNIVTNQFNKYSFRGKEYNYVCTRELLVDTLINTGVIKLPAHNLLEHQHKATLRLFQDSYDNNNWLQLQVQRNYPPLKQQDLRDLEKTISLPDQCQERFVRKELSSPKVKLTNDTLIMHSDTLIDSYHMRSIDAFTTEDYLKEENKYFRNYMIPSRLERKKFYKAAQSIVNSADSSNEFEINDLKYFWNDDNVLFRYNKYGVIEKILDHANEKDSTGYSLSYFDVDPTNKILVKGLSHLDSVGMKVQLIDIVNQNMIYELNKVYDIQWLSGTECFYSTENTSRRANRLHYLNFKNKLDTVLLEESDNTFDLEFSYSVPDSILLVNSESANETDVFFLNINSPNFNLKKLTPSIEGHKYVVQYNKGTFFILTNFEAPNFKVMSCTMDSTSIENWKAVIAERPEVAILDIKRSSNYLILKTIENSNMTIESYSIANKELKTIELEDEYMSLSVNGNSSKNDNIKISYSSPRIPNTTIDYQLASSDTTTVSKLKLKSEIDLDHYEIKKLFVPTTSDEQIPLTIYCNKKSNDLHKGMILKVYGAYGATRQPSFQLDEMVMMDKGFSFAIAHVRGGGAKGEKWYQEGKLLSKINSMEDYINCAEFLISEGYTTSDFLVSYGQSAAGIIQGYVINENPGLFKAMILDYPFLDVINTLSDKSLPLSTQEMKEWGNLDLLDNYNYIKAYSPFQNIRPNLYPNLLFYAGYKDFQSPYWQIAKHVLKLRDTNTGDRDILLSTNLNGGHFQDRNIMQKASMNYAFVVESLFGSIEEFNKIIITDSIK